jgi:hypothetical protein
VTSCRRRLCQRQVDHPLSHVEGLSGGIRDRSVLSRQRPAVPSSRKRSCQCQITVVVLPLACMVSAVPRPEAVRKTTFARQTCFCGYRGWRLPSISSLWSVRLNWIFVRWCIPQSRIRECFRESSSESKCKIRTTRKFEAVGNSALIYRSRSLSPPPNLRGARSNAPRAIPMQRKASAELKDPVV